MTINHKYTNPGATGQNKNACSAKLPMQMPHNVKKYIRTNLTSTAAICAAQNNKTTRMDTSTATCADGAHDAADIRHSLHDELAGTSTEHQKDTHEHRRRVLPRLDLDDSIAAAREAIKQAKKDMMEARRVNKNEKRKKKRLLKKAAQLSSEDLERIAVLKRSGWDTEDTHSAKKKKQNGSPGSSTDEVSHLIDNKTPLLQT